MNDPRFQDITVADMLANRSGIANSEHGQMADWTSLEPEFEDGSLERWVRSLTDERLLFAPGTGFELSNRAYAILGDVIAKASGQSYEDYMQDHILTPLGMGASTFLGEVGGHRSYLAGGQEAGFLAALIIVPAENLAVVAMGNASVVDAYYALDVAVDVWYASSAVAPIAHGFWGDRW